MFGIRSKHQAVLHATVAHTKPLVGMLQQFYGIPRGFWHDPFVGGFFTAMILRTIPRYSKRPTDDFIRGVVRDTYTALSNADGMIIVNHVKWLASNNDSVYNLGADRAHLYYDYLLERPYTAKDPLVLQATKKAQELKSNGPGVVDMCLIYVCLMEELEERFNIPKEERGLVLRDAAYLFGDRQPRRG